MKYIIRRSSMCGGTGNPKVEGAYRVIVHDLHKVRNLRCPDHMSDVCTNIKKEGDIWIGESKTTTPYYAVDINSIEELNAFVTKVGYPIIVSEGNNAEGFMEIEIYDDYRE